MEVDFILGEFDLALEIKGSSKVHEGDIRHLLALMGDTQVKKTIIVSLEKQPRILQNGIEVLPWRDFIERLWIGEFC